MTSEYNVTNETELIELYRAVQPIHKENRNINTICALLNASSANLFGYLAIQEPDRSLNYVPAVLFGTVAILNVINAILSQKLLNNISQNIGRLEAEVKYHKDSETF